MKEATLAAALLLWGLAGVTALDHLRFDVLGNEYVARIGLYLDISSLRMTERVYGETSNSHPVSEIDWEIGPQAGAGAGFSVAPVDPFKQFGLAIGGKCTWYFPVNDRTVRDSDWDNEGMLFSYAETSASTLTGMEAEGSLAAYIPMKGKCIISAGAEIWYARYGTIAHGGWIQQVPPGEPWNSYTEKITLYGASMTYLQEWFAIAPALGVMLKTGSGHIGLKAAISPWVWGYHIDNHYFKKPDEADSDQRYVSYIDSTKDGLYYSIHGEWFWYLTGNAARGGVQIGISAHFSAVDDARGDTTTSTAGLASYSWFDKDTAGAAISNLSFGLTIRTTL